MTPTFYVLPKVQKCIQDPPGRLIVSGNNCLTENASSLLDKQLRPHAGALPSYLKDTIHVLTLL